MIVKVRIEFLDGPIDGTLLECCAEVKPGESEDMPPRFCVTWNGESIKIFDNPIRGCSVYVPFRYKPFDVVPTHVYAFNCRL